MSKVAVQAFDRSRPRWALALLWAVLLLAGAPAAQAATTQGTHFSSYIEDLPIMPGLTETPDGYVVDLYQGGRLAQARLTGAAEPQVVRGFYSATLAQLGWKVSPAEPYVYHRGRERLSFTVETTKAPLRGARLLATFALTPDTAVTAPAAKAVQ